MFFGYINVKNIVCQEKNSVGNFFIKSLTELCIWYICMIVYINLNDEI